MFTYIRLKNFLSFGEVTFNFKKNANTAKQFVAIYGENGSGKSNFVKSIDLLCNSFMSFERSQKTNEFAKLVKESSINTPNELLMQILSMGDMEQYLSSCRMLDCDEATEVEYGLLLNGIEGVYKFSFAEKFINESLYYFTGKQRGYLFNISVDESNHTIKKKFWSGFFLNLKVKEEIEDDIDKFWGKHTLLGIISKQIEERNINYIKESFSEYLLNFIDLVHDTTVIGKQTNTYNTGIVNRKPHHILSNLRSGKISTDMLPQLECSERILRDFFVQTYADIKDVTYERIYVDDKIHYQLFVDKMIAGKVRHISFENESAGTQQILEIVRMLLGLFCGVTVVYDEIDDGIHDVLLKNIITSMMDEISGQLIITTHNTLLLESIDIRSAYIIQVDYKGNKIIRCFDEFPIQNTNNARIKYLKGVFGGTPYIDGIDYDFIIEEIENFKGDE